MSKIKLFLNIFFVVIFLMSCAPPIQPQKKPSVRKDLPPGVENAMFIVPNGGTLQMAKIVTKDTREPFKVNVNEWINKLVETNSKEYVEPEMYVVPIFDFYSCLTMKVEDMEVINKKLINNGFKFQLESKEKCLNSQSIP